MMTGLRSLGSSGLVADVVLGLLITGLLAPAPAATQMHAPAQGQVPLQSPVQRPSRALFPGQAAPPLVIADVTVIVVRDGRRLPHQTVVITNRHIQAFGRSTLLRRPVGARVVSGRGKYLIPGLWDMHIHIAHWPEVVYPLLLANGVTGIRDMGSDLSIDTLKWWRREIAAGRRVGPRQPFLLGQMYPDAGIQTPVDARRAIDSTQAAGAEFFKQHGNGMPRDAYFALLAEARRVGLPVVGHLPFMTVSAAEASDSGQRSIEHTMPLAFMIPHLPCSSQWVERGGRCQPGTDRRIGGWLGRCDGDSATVESCGQLAQRFRRNGTWFTPTLAARYYPGAGVLPYRPILSQLPYLPDSVRRVRPMEPLLDDGGRRLDLDSAATAILSLMAQAGMPILAGTDAWIYALLHEELALLVEKGFTPLAALQAATLNPAQYMGLTDSLGTIAPGQLADLVLLDADPLVDIRHTAQVRAVVADGRYFDRAALDRLLAAVTRRVQANHLHELR